MVAAIGKLRRIFAPWPGPECISAGSAVGGCIRGLIYPDDKKTGG